MEVSDSLRQMMKWIRTNVPNNTNFPNFMAAMNRYLLAVETQGIPSMWSPGSDAVSNELEARKAADTLRKLDVALENYSYTQEELGSNFYAWFDDYIKKVETGVIR